MMTAQAAASDGYQAFKQMLFNPGCSQALSLLDNFLASSQLSPELREIIRDCGDKVEQLEFEFNRLCVGPYKIPVPPYESVFVSGRRQLMTDDTLKVVDRYQQLGLVANPEWGEPPDFIGTELEFLGMLESMLADESNDTASLRQLADEFLLNHPGKWHRAFTQAMLTHAQHPFWGEFSRVLSLFLDYQLEAAAGRQQQVLIKESRYDIQ